MNMKRFFLILSLVASVVGTVQPIVESVRDGLKDTEEPPKPKREAPVDHIHGYDIGDGNASRP